MTELPKSNTRVILLQYHEDVMEQWDYFMEFYRLGEACIHGAYYSGLR